MKLENNACNVYWASDAYCVKTRVIKRSYWVRLHLHDQNFANVELETCFYMEVSRKGPYSQIDAKRSFANDAFVVSFYRQVSHMGPNGHIDAKTSFAIVFSKHLHSQNDAQHPRKWCSETIIFSAAPVNVCQRQWQWHVSYLRHSTVIAPLTCLVNSSPVRYSAALFREAGDPASEANLSGYYVVLNYLVNK